MTLIRNIILAFVAMFVLGVAEQASAKTLTEIDACKDAALAAAPFTGSVAKREVQARHLDGTDFVVINGERVSATRPIWNLCEGPSLEEQLASANVRIASLERQNARLTTASTSSRDTLAATKAELGTAKATIKSEKFFGRIWLVLGLIVLALLGLMIFAFSRLWDDHARLQRRMDALKSAPPEESTLGKMHDGPTPAGSGAEG